MGHVCCPIIAQVGDGPGVDVDRIVVLAPKSPLSIDVWREGGAGHGSYKNKSGAMTQASKRCFTVLNLNFNVY